MLKYPYRKLVQEEATWGTDPSCSLEGQALIPTLSFSQESQSQVIVNLSAQ